MRGIALGLAVTAALSGCGQRLEIAVPDLPAGPPAEELGTRPGRSGADRHRDHAGSVTPASTVPLPALRVPDPPPAPSPGQPLDGARPAIPNLPTVPGRVAVVVGVDDYPEETRDLTAAVSDARLVARAFRRLGFRRVVLLVEEDATGGRILAAARWLARRTSPREVGAFFYAGHVRRLSGDPDGDGEDVDEALVGADGGTVTDGAVARALSGARGPLWLAFAGCYAAGFSDAAGPGRVATYASDERSLSYESPALGHSFMVEFMVRRALFGMGRTSAEGMLRWAVTHMTGRYRRFRPLQEDGVRGALVLGQPAERGVEPERRAAPRPTAPKRGQRTRPCLIVLRCKP